MQDFTSRIAVHGEPGAGKTTFVKQLCYLWAKDRNKMTNFMGQYYVVLAITLRHVKQHQKLMDIIKMLMSFISIAEIGAILNKLIQSPTTVCLLLDGYDEMRNSNVKIEAIVRGGEEKNTKVVTTTRPHRILDFRSWGEGEEHISLKGFSKEQAKLYIKSYFSDRKESSEKMIEQINEQRMWQLTIAPIRLEMMCTVWSNYGTLGKRLSQIYEMFLYCLLRHMEERHVEQPETQQNKLHDKYRQSHIIPTAAMAYTWISCGKLKITFDYTDLEKIERVEKENILDLGCIVEVAPTTNLEKLSWRFPHLSIQEYFVAYYISVFSESSQVVDAMLPKGFTVYDLESKQNILKFLCGIHSSVANNIISQGISNTKGSNANRLFTKLLCSLLSEYNNEKDCQFPLPSEICIGSNFQLDFANEDGKRLALDLKLDVQGQQLKRLFIANNSSNVHVTLLVFEVSLLFKMSDKNLDFVKEIFVVVSDEEEINSICGTLSCMNNIQTAYFNITPSTLSRNIHHTKFPKVLKALKKLQTLHIRGDEILVLGNIMMKSPPKSLKHLYIHELGSSIEHINAFHSALRKAPTSIYLTLAKISMIDCFTEKKSSPKIVELELGGLTATQNVYKKNLFEDINSFTDLQILRTVDVFWTETALHSVGKCRGVKELDLLHKNSFESNIDFDMILNVCENLKVLLINTRNIYKKEMDDEPDNPVETDKENQESNYDHIEKESKSEIHMNLEELLVAGNIQYKSMSFSHKLQNLQQLYLVLTDETMELLDKIVSLSPLNLKTLLIWTKQNVTKTTKQITEFYPANVTPKLEELYLYCSKGSASWEEIWELLEMLPETFRHLVLSGFKLSNFKKHVNLGERMKQMEKLTITYHTLDGEDQSIIEELKAAKDSLEIIYNEDACFRKLSQCSVNPDDPVRVATLQRCRKIVNLI